MHFSLFLQDVGTKQLIGRLRAIHLGTKVLLTIFGSGKIFWPYRVGEVAKGPKNRSKTDHFSRLLKTAISLWKTSNTFFDNRAKWGWVYIWILVTFFCQKKKIPVQKPNFGNSFSGHEFFFLTLELKSVNSFSSSFGKAVRRPINLFHTCLPKWPAMGTRWFWGPKLKKNLTYCTMPKRPYCCEKLPIRFSTIGPNKGELLFGYS